MFTLILVLILIYGCFKFWKEILVTLSVISLGSVASRTFRKIMMWIFIYIVVTLFYFTVKLKNFIYEVDKTINRDNETEMTR